MSHFPYYRHSSWLDEAALLIGRNKIESGEGFILYRNEFLLYRDSDGNVNNVLWGRKAGEFVCTRIPDRFPASWRQATAFDSASFPVNAAFFDASNIVLEYYREDE